MLTLAKNNYPLSSMRIIDNIWNTDLLPQANSFQNELLPPVNIKASVKLYQLQIAAPGYKKDDFKVLAERGLLTISAQDSSSQLEKEQGYTRKEFSSQAFTRSFNLPEDVLDDNISARYEDGLLCVDLKRSAHDFNAKKEIKVA